MIQQMKATYPVRQVCAALDCPLSTAYYQPVARDERQIITAIEHILMQFPFYGYRKVRAELVRRGIDVGEHVVRRLLRQLGMRPTVGKLRVRSTDSNHPHPRYPNRIRGLTLGRPNQVWVADIT